MCSQPGDNFGHRSGLLLNLVLPQSNNGNAVALQPTSDEKIALAVAADFFLPKQRVLLRRLKALRTTVPEAPVDKNSDTMFRKVEVGFASDGGFPNLPAGDAIAS